jgi:hypothetical protein
MLFFEVFRKISVLKNNRVIQVRTQKQMFGGAGAILGDGPCTWYRNP